MSVEIHIRRLHRYDDLSAALAGLPDTLNIDAAFIISEIGSLMPAVLRFVGAKTGTVVHSDTEILSLSGALARNESGGSHIRMAVYDQNDAVFGGHLMVWSMVRATAEIVIGIAPEWSFARQLDDATGFGELVATPKPPKQGWRTSICPCF